MRVLFCKIACPNFVCFCKPASSIYTPGPLRLESAPSASAPSYASSDISTDPEISRSASTAQGIKGESAARVSGKHSNGDHNCLKSSIKRHGSLEVEKKNKRVQWVDVIGKQLAEVREFESSEGEGVESGFHGSRTCLCAIL